ncbi:MAG: gamma-glutamyltransferase [Anaerolineae bacterium]
MPSAFRSRRSVVHADHGMVATSQPLAVQAGLSVLQAGGNAVDAAVVATAVLGVVEPMSTGIGGDLFALVYDAQQGRVRALNASGRAPLAATRERMAALAGKRLPESGPLTVTVPGAVDGMAELLAAHGTLSLGEALAPAIGYAEEGFPVSELIGQAWAQATDKLRRDAAAASTFLVDGKAPRIGHRCRLPDLARTLAIIAQGGRDAFYHGPIAQALAKAVRDRGGLLDAQDLAMHKSTWEEPIEVSYRGHRVLECPPPGQGMIALQALGILQAYDLKAMRFGFAETLHHQIEAIKLAFADAQRYIADPSQASVPVAALLSPDYLEQRLALLDPQAASGGYSPGRPDGDTVYVTAVDRQRNAASVISSLYHPFGSGITAPGTGIMLQSRGALFSLEPSHPNCIAPLKRPYHTIIPAMVFRGPQLLLSFGVMGGFMQPQGHVQVLCNLLDFGMDVQEALDAPRFRWTEGTRVAFETGLSHMSRLGLEKRGHTVVTNASPWSMGGAQAIRIDPETGLLQGGSDPRKDGCAAGF